MKRLILVLLAVLFSCSGRTEGIESHDIEERWQTIVPYRWESPAQGLWRYYDKTCNVLIYVNSSGSMTAVNWRSE